jgi:hypothetical protein
MGGKGGVRVRRRRRVGMLFMSGLPPLNSIRSWLINSEVLDGESGAVF